MRNILFITLCLIAFNSDAVSLPCVNKGGVSHCDDISFVCKDGSTEKLTITCTDDYVNYINQDSTGIAGDTNHDGILSGDEQYKYNSEEVYKDIAIKAKIDYENRDSEHPSDNSIVYQSQGSSNSAIHTGKRGGRYIINSHGNKSYIKH